MNQYYSVRLTPSNSPYFRSPALRSPNKINKIEEPRLKLRKVLGSTTNAANGFDCLPSLRKFAYTAGAAVIVASVNEDHEITQQFFRARPNTSADPRDGDSTNPGTPTPNESRSRALISLKDSTNGSSWASSGRDWSDSPLGKSLTAKDRVKAAISVALSPNGKWLAVGESGYKPRVLIYRTTADQADEPVAIVAEHTFGVNALGFSPDSRYLASLGTANDGFLYIWRVDDRVGTLSLQAANKCTTAVNTLVWMGTTVVTAGLRFAKVWRLDEEPHLISVNSDPLNGLMTPRPRLESRISDYNRSLCLPKAKVLAGKSILLGDMLEANFVQVLPFRDAKAYLCAESGEICLLDDADRQQSFFVVAHAGFRVTAASLLPEDGLQVFGAVGQSRLFTAVQLGVRSLLERTFDRRKTSLPTSRSLTLDEVMIVATAMFGETTIQLDSFGGLKLSRPTPHSLEGVSEQVFHMPAHEAAVLGAYRMRCHELPTAAFFTFSGNGIVQIWDANGITVSTIVVPIDTMLDAYGWENEIRAAAMLDDAGLIAIGDKHGTLSLLHVSRGNIVSQARAHTSEVVDIACLERSGMTLIATGGRDRTIQLFEWTNGELVLVQTLDEHAGAISGLLFTSDGEYLLSCSADRTVVVREAMLRDGAEDFSTVFAITRTITLKSAPTSICSGAQDDAILVSTTDRCITNFNIRTGQTGFGFKCSDSDGGEAAVMSKILLTRSLNSNPTIVGVSSSDKSVRLYSEIGTLLARDWGHTEGITDVAIVAHPSDFGQNTIVTVAADSTIFLWDASPTALLGRPTSNDSQPTFDFNRSLRLPIQPPLRKVLSHSELTKYRRRKALDDDDSASPTETPLPPTSPHRTLRTKSSRASIAQPPKLEPTVRRKSAHRRSPSPPSPPGKSIARRPSLGIPLRSRTSESVLSASSAQSGSNPATSFGTLGASTESVCRTLRSYRKKLSSTPADQVSPEVLRDVEKELKLTARVLSQKSQGRPVIDEAMMTRLLDRTSERIVNMLDERLKGREKVLDLKDEVDKIAADMDSVSIGSS